MGEWRERDTELEFFLYNGRNSLVCNSFENYSNCTNAITIVFNSLRTERKAELSTSLIFFHDFGIAMN